MSLPALGAPKLYNPNLAQNSNFLNTFFNLLHHSGFFSLLSKEICHPEGVSEEKVTGLGSGKTLLSCQKKLSCRESEL